MTREEALKILDTIPTIGEQVDALEMAIKSLEQESSGDLISRDKIHEIIAVALSEYITDEERETLETLDVDVANIPTIQAVPIEVLDKIRDEIEAEMNDLYRQPSIDQRTLTIIHACQRHIAIIDEYRGEQK